MQVRRTACKRPEAMERFRKSLRNYSNKYKRNGTWPKWYRAEDEDAIRWQQVYPDEQPHPSTAEYEQNWDEDICAMGPIGLLIESTVWHGMKIDSNFKLWQKNEQPISIMEVPYQSLKPLLTKAAGRARNRAEWHRGASSKRARAPLETDRDLSRIAQTLDEEGKGILRVIQMGGNLAGSEVADFNEDVNKICQYCNAAPSTQDHIRWECSFFAPTRMSIDEGLAKLPHHCIPSCLKNGIAPAMKVDGNKTYWGTDFDDQLDENSKRMLGQDRELHNEGTNRDETDARKAALEIIDGSEMQGLNARQIMVKHKAAHGSGVDPSFPDADEIEGCMQGYPPSHWVNIYGDGSYTTPTLWWAALGGYGIWMPKWPQPSQVEQFEPTGQEQPVILERILENDEQQQIQPYRETTSYHGPAIGQTGTSTRQELTAWITVLTIPCRSCYATDSASVLNKALRLIEAAERDLVDETMGISIKRGNPFKKPWGLQVDGDLWEQAWEAVLKRGVGNQSLRKVKGHATEQDVADG